ncbi:MAG: hypothetical protein GY792_36130 [Gammaproteobacteria bacterium]|nr:hypothetical protein [Gammaproteobacteria bacterium]
MEDFIRMAVEKLGFPEEAARVATVDLLQMIVDHVGAVEAEELLWEFPEIQGMLEQAQSRGVSGVMRKVRSVLGLYEDISAIMLNVDRGAESLRPFMRLFVGFLKANTGGNLAARILGQFQALDESLG